MFDTLTQEKIGYYVYMLVNPIDGRPFYVGKGNCNRVFDHVNQNVNQQLEVQDLKLSMINDIRNSGHNVEHIIVKHGLTNKEAIKIEAALIDTLNYCGILLSNKVLGHHSIEKGLMTANHVKSIYNAQQLNSIDNDCLLININKRYERDKGDQAIYEATKGVWAIDQNRLVDKQGNILRKYVLSEYRGLVVEVFEVSEWYPAQRPYGKKAKKHGQFRSGMAFNGEVAESHIRDKYLFKSIAHLKKRGSATAHRFSI